MLPYAPSAPNLGHYLSKKFLPPWERRSCFLAFEGLWLCLALHQCILQLGVLFRGVRGREQLRPQVFIVCSAARCRFEWITTQSEGLVGVVTEYIDPPGNQFRRKAGQDSLSSKPTPLPLPTAKSCRYICIIPPAGVGVEAGYLIATDTPWISQAGGERGRGGELDRFTPRFTNRAI